MEIPKLNKIENFECKYPIGSIRNGHEVLPKNKRKNILLLSDDLRLFSGIATMSKEFVFGTVHKYNWSQLGSALNHPEKGKIFDISKDVIKETSVEDASVKIYPFDGYGNPMILRELMSRENPDAILHYTDPRFWGWLYQMEHELRMNIPIFYYNIWDCAPPPLWNKPFYQSCDLIMNISKQTHGLVKSVLGEENYVDFEKDSSDVQLNNKTVLSYVPHGVSDVYFKPLTTEKEKEDAKKTAKKMWGDYDKDFIVFFNNRNIRRKMIPDVIYAFKTFCDMLPKAKSKKCMLALHTNPIDDNGTDLIAIIEAMCQDYTVVFSKDKATTKELNDLYNSVDVTINIASNEGFGLGTAESLMAGTPILVNTTGGLQDQCGFKNETGEYLTVNDYTEEWPSNHDGRYRTCGNWAKVVWPANRSLQGSVPTPFIADDRCNYSDVAIKLKEWYDTSKADRIKYGLEGHEYLKTKEAGMSSSEMSNRFIESMDFTLKNWQPRKKFSVIKCKKEKIKQVKLNDSTFDNKYI